MLGDTGVAVHPDDPKWKHLIGKYADPAAGRSAHPDRGRRIFRSGEGLGRGEDHAGARLQRLRGRPAAQVSRPSASSTSSRRIEREGAGELSRPRPLRRRARRSWLTWKRLELVEKIEPHTACRALWRSRRRAGRAVSDRAVVRRCRRSWRSRADRGGARRPREVRARARPRRVLPLDGEHRAVVHLAPALVGPSDSGLVRAGQAGVRRADRGRGEGRGAHALRQGRRAGARSRRARHLVQLGAVAVLDAGLARRDAGTREVLSRRRAGDRLGHPVLLGRPHDDDGHALHGARCRSAPSTCTGW